jgi:hypothetical protein
MRHGRICSDPLRLRSSMHISKPYPRFPGNVSHFPRNRSTAVLLRSRHAESPMPAQMLKQLNGLRVFDSSSSPKVWKSGLVRPVRIRAYSQELAVIALRMFAVVLYKCLVVAAHTVILLVLVHTAHTARTSSYCSYCSCCSYYSYPDPVPQFFFLLLSGTR